jgi:probable F420-dependent oxidoreductase
MRLAVSLPIEEGLPVPRLVELARTAEECGYEAVVAGEVAGPDVFVLLAAVATATKRIRLGTGVIPMATRSVALQAMGFQAVASLAPGRVVAGVGVSSPLVIEGWHGRTFAPPLAYAREYLPALRAALDGERLELAGPHIRSAGFRTTLPTAGARIPILLGAMRPRMIELAAELADGVFLTWCPPEEAFEQVSRFHAAAERAGRDPAELTVVASFFAYAGPHEDEARERLRRFVLQYANVSTHQASFARAIPNLREVQAAWAEGDRKGALALLSDESVEAMCPVGAAAAAARVAELHAVGVDLPVMLVPGARQGDAEGPFETVCNVAQAFAPATT